jgi:MFS family permease
MSTEPDVNGQTKSYLAAVAEYLALRRDLSVLLAVILFLGIGGEMWERFLPKYLEVLGAGALVIGLFGTLTDLLDAVYQIPGGMITDRLGTRRALVLFNVLSAVGLIVYLLAPSWPVVFAATLLVYAWSSLSLPATFSIIGDSLPTNKRGMGFAVQSIIRRVPRLIGPPLGGLAIAWLGVKAGVQVGLAVSVVLALAAIVFQRKYYTKKDEPAPPPAGPKPGAITIARQMHPGLKRLLWADVLARFAEGIPKPFIVLYVLNELHASSTQFGVLTALSMAVSIAVYIPIARLADRSANRSPYIALTFLFFALTPLALILSHNQWLLALAFVVMGLREIAEPTRKATIVDLSNPERRATDVGVYYAIRQFAVVPCGVIGGLLWRVSPQLPFWVAFGVGVLGATMYWLMTRRGPDTMKPPPVAGEARPG